MEIEVTAYTLDETTLEITEYKCTVRDDGKPVTLVPPVPNKARMFWSQEHAENYKAMLQGFRARD